MINGPTGVVVLIMLVFWGMAIAFFWTSVRTLLPHKLFVREKSKNTAWIQNEPAYSSDDSTVDWEAEDRRFMEKWGLLMIGLVFVSFAAAAIWAGIEKGGNWKVSSRVTYPVALVLSIFGLKSIGLWLLDNPLFQQTELSKWMLKFETEEKNLFFDLCEALAAFLFVCSFLAFMLLISGIGDGRDGLMIQALFGLPLSLLGAFASFKTGERLLKAAQKLIEVNKHLKTE